MKKTLVFLLIIIDIFASSDQIGFGIFSKESRYIGGKEKLYPFFKVDYKNFYIKGSELGMGIPLKSGEIIPFIKKDTTEGFKKGELSENNLELSERKPPVLLGVKYGNNLKNLNYEFGLNHDFTSKGNNIFFDVGYQQELLKFLYFLPSINFTYSDENYTDYYFGLSKEESISLIGNPYKDLKGSFRTNIQLGIALFVSYKLGVFLSYNNEFVEKSQYNEKFVKGNRNESLTLMSFYRF